MPESVVMHFFGLCQAGNFDKMNAAIIDTCREGYPAIQVITQLQEKLVRAEGLTDMQKAAILIKLAEADKMLADGECCTAGLVAVKSSAHCVSSKYNVNCFDCRFDLSRCR